MAFIASVGVANPPHEIKQDEAMTFVKTLFHGRFRNLERMLRIFENGQVEKRYVSAPINWFADKKPFHEKNKLYIDTAVTLSEEAVNRCLNSEKLRKNVDATEIDAVFFVSTTGISAPSIDAYLMNRLHFSPYTKRIPIWGLGCCGGASGLARALEYCTTYPKSNVLLICVELCSVTFQQDDTSKSNLIGTSLFGDGAACALICGEQSSLRSSVSADYIPTFVHTEAVLMKDSLDVMGWDVQENGLYVIFSRDIPSLVHNWFAEEANRFLRKQQLSSADITAFIAHPGGKKVLDAYAEALSLPEEKLDISRKILKEYGNMSSATILFVLKEFLNQHRSEGEHGLVCALGPGFSTEFVLLQWKPRDA
ncbi:3-oxoacyl-[acyl-carrier-protein] synthase III C-terminal domain-containing protein [Bacillus tianshenii]|nr:3-oxoacyl-[acyl-carrier-protein] synthase III C-terminal domain-containing protein [Bacillus tianshenii]